MDKKKKNYPKMEELLKFSFGELVAVYDSKEKAQQHIRQQFFKDMQSKTARQYHDLSASNRKIINGLIGQLTNGEEHQGFNLNVFLYWMELSGVTLHDIALHFLNANVKDVIYSNNVDFEDYFERLDAKEIKRRIDYSFGSKHFKNQGGVNYVKALSDCLLFAPELILDGHGTMEWVKQEVLEEYDKSPDFYELARDGDTGELLDTIKNELENFAEHLNKQWNEIVDTKYGVINYTYGYRFLEESKDESKKAIVDYMIERLYFQQREYENCLSAQKKKHEAELKQLYARILVNGYKKGDFTASSELDESLNQL